MKNFMGIILGIGFLFYLAYLPSFLFYVLIGQHIQPVLGISETGFILVSNILFGCLLLGYILWEKRRHRYF